MTPPNPLIGWQFERASVRTIGRDLQRPECILAERDGTLITTEIINRPTREFVDNLAGSTWQPQSLPRARKA